MDNTLIGVAGICDLGAINFRKGVDNFWTQISVQERLTIPEIKPEIEQITSTNVAVRIIRKKVVVTPSTGFCPNFEGRKLTGRKLIVEGEICQTVSFTADRCEQPVHSAHFAIPFSAFITVPKKVWVAHNNCEKEIDSLHINFQVNACLEDVFFKEINNRQFFSNVMLLLQAVPAVAGICLDEC